MRLDPDTRRLQLLQDARQRRHAAPGDPIDAIDHGAEVKDHGRFDPGHGRGVDDDGEPAAGVVRKNFHKHPFSPKQLLARCPHP